MIERKGFSLVELLVVIAIIAVLIGLILPAIQKVRESAAKTHSQNNLKQLGLAVQSYEHTHRHLPSYLDQIDTPQSVGYASTFVKILPYVEQQSLYQEGLKHGITALQGQVVTTFISPADASTPHRLGWTSYVVNWRLVRRGGITFAANFTDGTSNTILFTERYMQSGTPAEFNCWVISTDGSTINAQARTLAAVLRHPDLPQFAPQSATATPNLASTPHRSGILVGLADGSTRGISPSVASTSASGPTGAVTLWAAAMTQDGGETFSW